ncbi:MAG: PilZ domain-containing protein, partial [Terriglobia bacterium]
MVENDSATLRQLVTTLKEMGAAPRCLANSQRATELINKEKFDGAFLNWDTPELKGKHLTRVIRGSKSNAKIPIVIVTARTGTRALAEAFKVGVTFYLSKPIGRKSLTALLNASRGAIVEERRRYQRVPLTGRVECRWGIKWVTTRGINLSSSGLLVLLSPRPAVGTVVWLEFTLPQTHHALALKGSVARTGPGRQVGIKFTEVSREQRNLLTSYIDR